MSTQPAGIIPTFTLADRLRKARELTGLEQREFADQLGISRTSVSNAETGTTRPIKVTLKAWALRSGVDYEWLTTGAAGDPHPWAPWDSNPQPTDCGYPQVIALNAA